jgi:hypothetical protein
MRYALKSIVAGAMFACACCFARQVLAGEARAKRPGPIPDVAVDGERSPWPKST